MGIKHTKEYAEKLAEIHANELNESWTNNYYSFIHGYMKAIEETAAPELLEALIEGEKELRELYNTVEFEGKFPVKSTLDRMLNAINKATK